MPPASASASVVERWARNLLADYAAHLERTGHGHVHSEDNARRFLRRFPDPGSWVSQPLAARLVIDPNMASFLSFFMLHGHLHPGYDYLVRRKLSSFWRDLVGTPIEADMARFRQGAESIGSR